MKDRKTFIRFFTIADYEEEEIWLREQSQKGWKLVGNNPPCFYTFEKSEPEEVIYKLDYRNGTEDSEYRQMFSDFGWEECGRCFGWIYYRKPASAIENDNDGEIFSDPQTRYDMIMHIYKTRMMPLLVIFLCCVTPQWTKTWEYTGDIFFKVFLSLLFILYVFLLLHCGVKLWNIKKKLEKSIKY